MKPLVVIVIINWNGGETTLNCLKSLYALTDYPNYKVIMLDNGSKDNSDKKAKKLFPKLEIIRKNKNLGYTSGINLVWKYALEKYNPDYFCNMNNDIITTQKEWLSLMVDTLEKKKSYGICGNKLLFPDNRFQLLYLERHPKSYSEKDNGQYDFIREVSAVGGANMIVKMDVVKKIGGVDENFFYGPDDIDYCFRAKKEGFNIIYNGLSKSVHIGSFSYLSSSKDFIYKHQSYGQLLFSLRHDNLVNNLKMSLNQFVRAFVTRKDPFSERDLKNIYFHKSFIKRAFYFFIALTLASKNYKNIVNENFR